MPLDINSPDEGKPNITAQFVFITPELAQEMLGRSTKNRKISQSVVRKYAREMSGGLWLNNAQPIILNGNQVLNGYHRLTALIEAGVGIWFLVVNSVDPIAMHTMDTGRNRTLGQMFQIDGEKAYDELAALVKVLKSYRSTNGSSFVRTGFTSLDYYEQLGEEPSVRDFASLYVRKVPFKIPRGFYAAIHFLLATKDRTQADTFMDQLITGQSIQKGDPTYAMRETLLEIDEARPQSVMSSIGNAIVDMWNEFRQDRKVQKSVNLQAKKYNKCPEIL